jgi:molecular chaperone HscA
MNASEDKTARALREQQVEAERLILSLQEALAADGDLLLSEEERAQLNSEIDVLIELSKGSDALAIEKGVTVLAKASDEFAARRMDNSIQKALQGHSVDELGDAG